MNLIRAGAGFPHLAEGTAMVVAGQGAARGLWAALPRNGMGGAKGLGRAGPGHVQGPALRRGLGRVAATGDFAAAEFVGPRFAAAARRGCS